MAKPTPLSSDLMSPPAAVAPLSARPVASKAAPVTKGEGEGAKKEPFQLRWDPADVKAMKLAALQADMSYSDYMLACFHAYKKA